MCMFQPLRCSPGEVSMWHYMSTWLMAGKQSKQLMASKTKKILLNCVDRIKCLTYYQSTQWPFQSNGVWTLLQTCCRQLTMPSSAIPMTTWDTHHAHWTQEQEVAENVDGTRCLLKLTHTVHVVHLMVCYHLLLVQHWQHCVQWE